MAHHPQESTRTIEYIIGTLILILGVLLIFLIFSYRHLRHTTAFSARQALFSAFHAHHRGPAAASDIAFIRPWMTFEYINKFFNLPTSYLQTKLAINDSRYPRVTLSSYANHVHLNLASFLRQLDDTLRAHLSGTPPQATTTFEGYL